jgi:hypothetical protein
VELTGMLESYRDHGPTLTSSGPAPPCSRSLPSAWPPPGCRWCCTAVLRCL